MSKSILLKVVLLSLGALIFPWQSVQADRRCIGILCAQQRDPFGGAFSGNPMGVPMLATPMPGFGGSSLPGLDLMLMNAVVGRLPQQMLPTQKSIPTTPSDVIKEAIRAIQKNIGSPFELPSIAGTAFGELDLNPHHETGANVYEVGGEARSPIVQGDRGSADTHQQRLQEGGRSVGINMHTHPISENPNQPTLFSGLKKGHGAADLGGFLGGTAEIEALKVQIGGRTIGYAMVKPAGWQLPSEESRMAAYEQHAMSITRGFKGMQTLARIKGWSSEDLSTRLISVEERALSNFVEQIGVSLYKTAPDSGLFQPFR